MTVGDRIKMKREELGLSQGDLAKKMNVTRQSVSKAENHDNNITTTKVKKFAEALGVSESFLMGFDDGIKLERELSGKVAEDDIRHLTLYNKLKDSDKKVINDMIYALLLKND